MFDATAAIGGLDTQLVFFRGFDECKASRWVSNAVELHRLMASVSCAAGETQIGRVLGHALHESKKAPVGGLVFCGDAMEENADRLGRLAGELGTAGVPVFVFQEGYDPTAAAAFRRIASLSRGAYATFDLSAIERLKILLGAVAVYASGGRQALESYASKQGGAVLQLTSQLRGAVG